ncbi:MAG: MFS transporter [Alphaproteobacteria bacterium]|nr:MFS transporter [Alphaproteobacteria bacterium]
MQQKRSAYDQVPRGVWALGFVSLFMDISSEMIHSLLPVFLMTGLGASAILVGLIEGIGEGTASIVKIFSGYVSDWLGKRKLLALIGYGLGTLTKPVFALALTPYEVLAARFIDRVGKGIRGAPRDALVADMTPASVRGAAFGVRQALDTVGAFTGPALAIALMWLYADNMRAVFWWAIVPGLIAVALLFMGVEDVSEKVTKPAARPPINWRSAAELGAPFWTVTTIGAVFAMARFSEAFLVLRAQNVGLSIALVPLIMMAMNATYAALTGPIGALSDRIGRYGLLGAGLIVLILADVVLALWSSVTGAFVGAAFWGVHMGLTQGLLATLVADTAPTHLRGTAFGVFNLIGGIATLLASAVAGALWETIGPGSTFIAGAAFACVALAGLALHERRKLSQAQ